MIILDEVISNQYQNHIYEIITDQYFPWSFLPEVTTYTPTNNKAQPAFSHIAYLNSKPVSKYYDIFYSLLLSICGKVDCEISELFRIRVGCLLRGDSKNHNLMHTDFDFQHKTMLYYVNDSDGDTIIDTTERIVTVSPKSGRIVLFDGNYSHASSNPIVNTHRFVITFNFDGAFK